MLVIVLRSGDSMVRPSLQRESKLGKNEEDNEINKLYYIIEDPRDAKC